MWQGGGEGYGANTQGTGYSAAPRQQTVRMFLTHLEQGKSLFFYPTQPCIYVTSPPPSIC